MQKIYIILTHTGTILSKIIKIYTKDEFSHVSIALDNKLTEMYSFGRLNPYNPFKGGFIHEYLDKGTFKRFKKTKAKIIEIEINDNQFSLLKSNISEFKKTYIKYKFNVIGLFATGFNIRLKREHHFYCAEFVKYILEISDINMNLPELIKPEDFKQNINGKTIYNGLLSKFSKEQINYARGEL